MLNTIPQALYINHIITIIMKFCALAVIGTLYTANAVDSGVSTKEAISNHPPLIPHETFANTLRAGRIHAAASRKLAKAAKNKRAKAQKEDGSSLFTSCDDVQAELDKVQAELDDVQAEFETYKAAASSATANSA